MILIDLYPVISGIWTYLINVKAAEIRRIPLVDNIDDLPVWVPQEAKWLIGFCMNSASTSPKKTLSSGKKKLREAGRHFEGWSEAMRERVAIQVEYICHWKIIQGNYTQAPNLEATWFIDPPYNNQTGKYYVHSNINYELLSVWCYNRKGQTIVCENHGATWLPFEPFAILHRGLNKTSRSKEIVWINR